MEKISIYNSFTKNNDSVRELIKQQLKQNGFKSGRDGELLIVVGGDGTFLSAIRKRFMENPIFVGFNTGNLGFLSEFTVDKLDEFLSILKNKDYYIQEVPVYEVRIKEGKQERIDYFVNDLVIERKSTRILHMSVHVNEKELCTISADGVILSSSLGSTGYNRSAGGAIILDASDTLQITPIAPVQSRAYQSLDSPVILNNSNNFTIFPSYKKLRSFRVVCDGKEIKCNQARFIDVKQSPYTVQILRSKKYNDAFNVKHKIFNES